MNKSESTIKAPVPAAKNVTAVLDELAFDMASSLELLQAADDLAVASSDGESPIHAIISRALAELRGQREALCALL